MVIKELKNVTSGQMIILATVPKEYRPTKVRCFTAVDIGGNVYKFFAMVGGDIRVYAYSTSDSGQMNFENTFCYIVD